MTKFIYFYMLHSQFQNCGKMMLVGGLNLDSLCKLCGQRTCALLDFKSRRHCLHLQQGKHTLQQCSCV